MIRTDLRSRKAGSGKTSHRNPLAAPEDEVVEVLLPEQQPPGSAVAWLEPVPLDEGVDRLVGPLDVPRRFIDGEVRCLDLPAEHEGVQGGRGDPERVVGAPQSGEALGDPVEKCFAGNGECAEELFLRPDYRGWERALHPVTLVVP